MKKKKQTGVNGRPRISSQAVRHTVGVRLSPAERTILQSKAEALGIRPTTFMRIAALSRSIPKPIVPVVNRQAYGELARLTGNLNQLLKAAHSGHVSIPPALLSNIKDLVQQLRLELLGVCHDRQDD